MSVRQKLMPHYVEVPVTIDVLRVLEAWECRPGILRMKIHIRVTVHKELKPITIVRTYLDNVKIYEDTVEEPIKPGTYEEVYFEDVEMPPFSIFGHTFKFEIQTKDGYVASREAKFVLLREKLALVGVALGVIGAVGATIYFFKRRR